MSKIIPVVQIKAPGQMKDMTEVQDYLTNLSKTVQEYLNNVYSEFNGKISLANTRYRLVSVTSSGTVDTDFDVTHDLGETSLEIPETFSYWIDSSDIAYKSAIVYKGTKAWTNSTITLRCSVASCPLKVMVQLT